MTEVAASFQWRSVSVVMTSLRRTYVEIPGVAVRARGRGAGNAAALGAAAGVAGADREPARSRAAGGQRRTAPDGGRDDRPGTERRDRDDRRALRRHQGGA